MGACRTGADRIPADVLSVEVTAVTTSAPERVLARRTVTGPDARQLVDLVNALDRDTRPKHPCPYSATIGRLLVRTGGGTHTVRIASCGRVTLVLTGDVSVELVAGTALTEAVDAVLGPLPTTPTTAPTP